MSTRKHFWNIYVRYNIQFIMICLFKVTGVAFSYCLGRSHNENIKKKEKEKKSRFCKKKFSTSAHSFNLDQNKTYIENFETH